MNERNNEAINLANEIITSLEKTPYDIINLRKFYRLVNMLEINEEKEWILNELQGYKYGTKVPDYRFTNYDVVGYHVTSSYQKINSCRLENETLKEGFFGFSPKSLIPILQSVESKVYYNTSEILKKLKSEKEESDIIQMNKKNMMEMGLSRFAKFISKYLYETKWVLVP